MRAQLYDRGQFDQPELVGQVCLDIFENTPDLASAQGRRDEG